MMSLAARALVLAATLAACSPGVAQDSGPSTPRPRAEFFLSSTQDSLRDGLNPGNVARRPQRTLEAALRLGVEFEGGELSWRLTARRQWISGQQDSASDSRLLRAHKNFDLGGGFLLSAGKKNLHLDGGYAFHPFDFLEDLSLGSDFADWRGREEGFPQLGLAWSDGDRTLRTLVVDDSRLAGTGTNRGLKQALVVADIAGSNWSASALAQQYEVGRVGWGLGGSATPTASLAVHGALFVRRGSVRPLHRGALSDTPLVFVPPADPVGRWRTDAREARWRLLLGGQYTSDSGLNVLAEYSYDANGLNRGEWQRSLRQVAFHTALAPGPLRSWNLAGDARSLATRRQHYVFVRAAWVDAPGSPELGALAGADGGGQLTLKGRIAIAAPWSAWLLASTTVGAGHTEFGMLPVRRSLQVGLQGRL